MYVSSELTLDLAHGLTSVKGSILGDLSSVEQKFNRDVFQSLLHHYAYTQDELRRHSASLLSVRLLFSRTKQHLFKFEFQRWDYCANSDRWARRFRTNQNQRAKLYARHPITAVMWRVTGRRHCTTLPFVTWVKCRKQTVTMNALLVLLSYYRITRDVDLKQKQKSKQKTPRCLVVWVKIKKQETKKQFKTILNSFWFHIKSSFDFLFFIMLDKGKTLELEVKVHI